MIKCRLQIHLLPFSGSSPIHPCVQDNRHSWIYREEKMWITSHPARWLGQRDLKRISDDNGFEEVISLQSFRRSSLILSNSALVISPFAYLFLIISTDVSSPWLFFCRASCYELDKIYNSQNNKYPERGHKEPSKSHSPGPSIITPMHHNLTSL